MIGFDTNILVRFFAQDDPVQCEQADELMRKISGSEPVWIGLAVILELVWVLSKTYRTGRAEMVRILERLLFNRAFVIEQIDTVHQALQLYRKGNADFADCLIASSAREAGCSSIMTFDAKAAREAGMQLVG
jgi:predicted nucleic-acid-binding protein